VTRIFEAAFRVETAAERIGILECYRRQSEKPFEGLVEAKQAYTAGGAAIKTLCWVKCGGSDGFPEYRRIRRLGTRRIFWSPWEEERYLFRIPRTLRRGAELIHRSAEKEVGDRFINDARLRGEGQRSMGLT